MKQEKKPLRINPSYYRKLLRDSYRLKELKPLVDQAHRILKMVKGPDQVSSKQIDGQGKKD